MNAANLKPIPSQKTKTDKKRILILISEGGGGHKMAGDSLNEILSPLYDIDIVNVITQVIYPLDLISSLTSRLVSTEDFYNFLLRKGYHRGVHVLATMGNKFMLSNWPLVEKLFMKFLSKAQVPYDLVISTVPFVNVGIATALQKKNIPFFIMPTDLDTATFFGGMSELDITKGGKFAFALPYDDDELKQKGLKNNPIPKENIVITGFPVRGECQKHYTPEQIELLKIKHGMFADHLTLTLVLGAAGNRMILQYTKELYKLSNRDFKDPLEINVCVGRNEKARMSIVSWLLLEGASIHRETSSYTTLVTKNGLIFHLRKFTKELIEIMACSHLIITKTGSCSVNEAIYLGKKLLLDNTEKSSARFLFWETFNVPFVRKHGLGDAFFDIGELNCMIRVLLKENLGHPVSTGYFPLPNFRDNILSVVSQLI